MNVQSREQCNIYSAGVQALNDNVCVPQAPEVYPGLTAEGMLHHLVLVKGIASRRTRRQVVETLLQRVDLWEARRHRLGTYSVDMKQRFRAALALLGGRQ